MNEPIPLLKCLRLHIREHGGMSLWAGKLGLKPSSLYGKLNGNRPILPDEATKLEKLTKGRFSKEKIIFGDAA